MEPFLGEVRLFAFNVCSRGWAACNGSLLPINQYMALFSLVGTMVWRRRTEQFRVARPAREGAAPRRHGSLLHRGAGCFPGARLTRRFRGLTSSR